MARITVTGRGTRTAAAQRASISVTTRWESASADESMRMVASEHQKVCDEARARQDAHEISSWHADRVWVSHHQQWVGDDKTPRTVFTASATLLATFTDIEALGSWIGELGVLPVHSLSGITWELDDETDAGLASTARADAIADAVRRAADYSAAAGLGTPVIVAIAESGAGTPPPGPAPMQMMRAAKASDSAPSLELAAGDIEVAASVDVTFEA